MSQTETSLADARALFGTDLLAPEDVERLLHGDRETVIAAGDAPHLDRVPWDGATLTAAHARGDLLVYRVARDASGPLTILRMLEWFPDTIDPRLRKGVGYQLKDEWTIDGEPVVATATCRPGWALVHRAPVPATCNQSYDLQEAALAAYAGGIGLGGRLARRTAVEALYDTVLLRHAHGLRLLEQGWDWTSTPTEDGGYLTVGHWSADGLHLIGYSPAVRFGTLGICAQLAP